MMGSSVADVGVDRCGSMEEVLFLSNNAIAGERIGQSPSKRAQLLDGSHRTVKVVSPTPTVEFDVSDTSSVSKTLSISVKKIKR